MSKKIISVEIEEHSYNLGQAVLSLISKIKDKAQDGIQASEIPEIATEALTAVVKAVGSIPEIPAESKDDSEAFIRSWSLAGGDILSLFFQKKASEMSAMRSAQAGDQPQTEEQENDMSKSKGSSKGSKKLGEEKNKNLSKEKELDKDSSKKPLEKSEKEDKEDKKEEEKKEDAPKPLGQGQVAVPSGSQPAAGQPGQNPPGTPARTVGMPQNPIKQ